MATHIQAAGRLEAGQADHIFYGPLSFEEETQKFPKFGGVQGRSARLISTQSKFEVFHGSLSTDDRNRAESFVHEGDRNRYLIAHGILQDLLDHYLGMAPEHVCFSYGTNGKPHLADSLAGSGLEFNFSHTANSAVYAFANRIQAGIDIELLNKGQARLQLSLIVFSASDQAKLAEILEDEKAETFLHGWTRKKPLVKVCCVYF